MIEYQHEPPRESADAREGPRSRKMARKLLQVKFEGAYGDQLSGRLDLPGGDGPRAHALFAHCFTCSKDIWAASHISTALADLGIAVLRFDFTGLGHSEGEFASTNFSSNVADLGAAAEFMRASYGAPQILVGHSLGGAAILAAAEQVPEAAAVVTLAAPADFTNLRRRLAAALPEIHAEGEARLTIGDRSFPIRRQFVEDLDRHRMLERIAALDRALLIFPSPRDEIVDIDNARRIFEAANQPKSFIALDEADHLLTRREDSEYVAAVIAAWAGRYLA
jgi:putative redox protein